MDRRHLCLLLALALALCALGASAGGLDYLTTKADPYYHGDAGCPACAGDAVRLSEGAARDFGKRPCPDCLPAKAYSSCGDTSYWCGAPVRLRETAGGWVELEYPCLAGDRMYYLRSTYANGSDDDWGFGPTPDDTAICRCRADDLTGEEVLLADPPENLGGLRDAGDGLLLWWSEYLPGNTVFHFGKLDYAGGVPAPLGQVQVKGMQNVDGVVVVDGAVWFSWCDCDLDISTETDTGKMLYVIGEIYRLPLSGGEAERVFSEPRMIYDLAWADGRLLFTDHDDYGWYDCALDPETGRRQELLTTAEEYAGLHLRSGMALGGRFYTWDDDRQCTVSVALDGSDLKVVSKDHFEFIKVWRGHVLAVRAAYDALSGEWYVGDDPTALYRAEDPAHPSFDPDRAEPEKVGDRPSFILGDRLYTPRDDALWVRTLIP